LAEKIALIVPIRLTANTHEGAERLERLCASVPRDLFDIVISDYGTRPAFDAPLRSLAEDGITVVRHPAPRPLFSIGHARDFGVAMARQKVVLFNDIDFFGTPEMYRRIHAEVIRRDIGRNMFDFFCVPVLFLTEGGTQAWFAAAAEGRPLVEPWSVEGLEAATANVQFTAFGSSAMVINRHHYLSLGGHDAKFSGHGAEDYDLLHRLAALSPLGPRPNGYFLDFKDNGVRRYWGFRALFALYGLDVFARGVHLVHLWHPRRLEKGYFRSRQNFRNLRKVMAGFERKGTMPPALADPAGQGRWLVLLRSAHDATLLRQLLPLSQSYVFRRVRSVPAAPRIAAIAAVVGADTIVVAPDVAGPTARLPADPALAAFTVMTLGGRQEKDRFTIAIRRPGQPVTEAIAEATPVTSGRGAVAYRRWTAITLAGIGSIESGMRREPEPLTAAIFESFGGETLLDRKRHPRPARKKKSSLWTRIKRVLSGY
jgi:predicted glycosyltransferase involved in capsule biosynthesis